MTRVVVIGANPAGASAANRAKRLDPSLEVVLVDRGGHTSYAACGLPYLLGGLVDDPDAIIARSPDEHRQAGLDVRVRHEVRAIDLEARRVELHDLDGGGTSTEGFDHLVVATGATPLRPPLEGIDLNGVLGVQTIPEALEIDALLRDRSPRRAVVVGGGYIGLEMAEAFVERGLQVTLVEKEATPMGTLDPDMGERVAAAVLELGIDLQLGVGVDGFAGRGGWVDSVAVGDRELPADVVVMGLGVRPEVTLAEDAGIPIGPSGAIATDARMATRVPGVWAAGDCAESLHRISHRPVAIALGTHANKQGRVVGTNLAGGAARFPGVIGTAITRVGSTEIARTGLGEAEAAAAGFATVTATAEGTTRASYMPGAADMAVKVVAERSTGRLLGAQIVGGETAGKRIDALAVAVWHGTSAEEFSMLDLSYVPPVASVWEASAIAARLAAQAAAASSSTL